MSLLIDLGNSRLKWAWSDASGLSAGGVLEHTSNQLHSEITRTMSVPPGTVVHISSVAKPDIREQLRLYLVDMRATQDWLISPAEGLGLRNSYATPSKLGIDRWLALAAAHAASQDACCVVDIGTAITVDVCDAQGQHLGGLIVPGPIALAQALKPNTALPMAAATLPEHLGLATDTEIALQYGALHAACGAIDRAYSIAHTQYACTEAMLTGGGAPLLSPYLSIPHRIDPDLVFLGLAMHARNYQSQNAEVPL